MEKRRAKFNFTFFIALIGFLAGIYLVFEGNYLIGISGSIASAGLAVMNYKKSN